MVFQQWVFLGCAMSSLFILFFIRIFMEHNMQWKLLQTRAIVILRFSVHPFGTVRLLETWNKVRMSLPVPSAECLRQFKAHQIRWKSIRSALASTRVRNTVRRPWAARRGRSWPRRRCRRTGWPGPRRRPRKDCWPGLKIVGLDVKIGWNLILPERRRDIDILAYFTSRYFSFSEKWRSRIVGTYPSSSSDSDSQALPSLSFNFLTCSASFYTGCGFLTESLGLTRIIYLSSFQHSISH